MTTTLTSFILSKDVPTRVARKPNMKAIVIQPEGTWFIEPFWEEAFPADHKKHVEAIVGGPYIPLTHEDDNLSAYIRENHQRFKANRRNDFGKVILEKIGFFFKNEILFGNIIIFGKKDEGEEDMGLANEQIKYIKTMILNLKKPII